MIGEPDAGKPPVRFDEGVQETCDIAARLRPTLRSPRRLRLDYGLVFSLGLLPSTSSGCSYHRSFRPLVIYPL
jgi:hypothetical protein